MATTTRKATHRGHCQVCGAAQKLPGGVLAKHGYTTRFHFFEGTCTGSGSLPFEQDTSLVQGMIAWARRQSEALRGTAAAERRAPDPDRVWYHMYLYDARGRGSYEWRQTRLRLGAYRQVEYERPADGRHREPTWERVYGGLPYDLAGCARDLADAHAQHLEKRVAQHDEYAAWQERRLQGWTPQPLTPVAGQEVSHVG